MSVLLDSHSKKKLSRSRKWSISHYITRPDTLLPLSLREGGARVEIEKVAMAFGQEQKGQKAH